MKKLLLSILALSSLIYSEVKAQSTNDVLNLLIQNKAVTQEQADSLRSEAAIKQQETDAKRKLFPINAGKALQFSGYNQIRYQFDDTKGKVDGFDIRRAYLNINGNLSPYWSYRLQVDFASSPKIMDAYGEYKLNEMFNFIFGQTIVPFSIDNITSNAKLDFIDRSQVTEALVGRGKDVIGNQNGRDLGVQVGGTFLKINDVPFVEYKIALLNGAGINLADKNEAKDVAARVVLHPVNGLGLGASFYDGVGTWVTPVQNKGRNRLGFEANYENKRISLRGEYIQGKDGEIKREGYYVQAGYYLLAQKFQLLAKLDEYDGNTQKPDDKLTWYVVGANYYFTPAVKLQFNYFFKTEEAKSTNNNLASIQMQFLF
jgi:phosphate-selective porin OprO and OprP